MILFCSVLLSIFMCDSAVISFFSLSEFRQTLALADAKRHDHKRKSGEKSSNITNTLHHKHNERPDPAGLKSKSHHSLYFVRV